MKHTLKSQILINQNLCSNCDKSKFMTLNKKKKPHAHEERMQ